MNKPAHDLILARVTGLRKQAGAVPGLSVLRTLAFLGKNPGKATRFVELAQGKIGGGLLTGVRKNGFGLLGLRRENNVAANLGRLLSDADVGTRMDVRAGLRRLKALSGVYGGAPGVITKDQVSGLERLGTFANQTVPTLSKTSSVKQAAPLGFFRQAGRFLGKQLPRVQQGLSRYGELLAGGNAQKMRPFEQFVAGIQRHFPQTSNTFGGRLQHAFDRFNTRLGASAFTAANGLGQMGDRIHPLVGNLGREAGQEMRSVIKARTATGAGLLGALGLSSAISGNSGNPSYQV